MRSWIQCLAALAALLAVAPARAQNLIPNPSFPDLAMLLGWDHQGVSTWSDIDAAEVANSGSVRVVRTSNAGLGPDSDCVPVEGDMRYRLAASALWLDAESSADGDVQVRVEFHQGTACGSFASSRGTGLRTIEPDAWQRVEAFVNSPANAESALVNLWGWRAGGSGTFVAYFDDVELVTVPEAGGGLASAAAAASLAGCARARRRTRVNKPEEHTR